MLALLAGCGRKPPPSTAVEACPAGVLAQTPRGDYPFTDGWVRLRLPPCPRATGAPAWLEVDAVGAALAFKPGRPGGATLGVLAVEVGAPRGAVQRFAVRVGPAREVVLAPMPTDPRPKITQLRLLASR